MASLAFPQTRSVSTEFRLVDGIFVRYRPVLFLNKWKSFSLRLKKETNLLAAYRQNWLQFEPAMAYRYGRGRCSDCGISLMIEWCGRRYLLAVGLPWNAPFVKGKIIVGFNIVRYVSGGTQHLFPHDSSPNCTGKYSKLTGRPHSCSVISGLSSPKKIDAKAFLYFGCE